MSWIENFKDGLQFVDGVLSGGTVQAILDNILSSQIVDETTIQAFLVGVAVYHTPKQLVHLILTSIDRISAKKDNSDHVILRVLNLFRMWIKFIPEEWIDGQLMEILLNSPELGRYYEKLQKYHLRSRITAIPSSTFRVWNKDNTLDAPYHPPDYDPAQKIPFEIWQKMMFILYFSGYSLKIPIQVCQIWKKASPPSPFNEPHKQRLKTLTTYPNSPNFDDFDLDEFARQHALYNHKLFRRIGVRDFCKNWGKYIHDVFSQYKRLSTTICYQILSSKNLTDRVPLIEKWITLADLALELKNYEGVNCIIYALSSASIQRLLITWNAIASEKKEKINKLRDIFLENRFGKYGQLLKIEEGPCVPHIGPYLTDYIFLNEGEPSSLVSPEDKVLNISKLRKEAQIYGKIKEFQVRWYTFYGVDVMWSWLDGLEEHEEKDLYKMSQKVIEKPKQSWR